MYYSEHGQDKWLNEHVFYGKRNGVFFECGAIDGIITSNSLFFERELGWNGLCVEANPEAYKKLEKNRTCKTEHAALCDRDGYSTEYLQCEGGLLGWGGIVETIEPQHWDRIGKHIPGKQQKRIHVPTITLHSVLTKHGLTKIDYLCLDIEGGEWPVLQAFDWGEFDIHVWDIEDNWGNYPIDAYMSNHGYQRIAEMGPSKIYLKG